MTTPSTNEQIADRVRTALQSADLDSYRDLLHPNVRWGAPGDATSGCHNRDQVIAWYRRGQARGVRARVTEMTVQGDKLLVGMRVGDNGAASEAGGEIDRWQVLTLVGGTIIDIRGFEDRESALAGFS